MKNKKVLVALLATLFFTAAFPVFAAGNKVRLKKAVITEIDGFTITATKNNRTYTINAQRAVLRNAKGKRATIDQFFAGDQIDVSGTRGDDGIIVARIIKNRSLKETSLTRRNVGSENLKDNAISSLDFIGNGVITEDKLQQGTITNASISGGANIDSSKLNLSDVSSLTSNTVNVTTLDLGTNTVTDGNFTGNWSFNSGNLSGIGTLSSGNITTSGTLTANGAGNNYFAGNVGVGTTGPGDILELQKEQNAGTRIVVKNTTAGTASYTGINFISDVSAFIRLLSASYTTSGRLQAGALVIEGQGSGGININANAGPLKFWQASTEYMRIDSGGNVGVGTTSPQTKLSINGEVSLRKNSSQPYACITIYDGAIALTNKYTTCVCKNGTGWVLTSDGTTACTWN